MRGRTLWRETWYEHYIRSIAPNALDPNDVALRTKRRHDASAGETRLSALVGCVGRVELVVGREREIGGGRRRGNVHVHVVAERNLAERAVRVGGGVHEEAAVVETKAGRQTRPASRALRLTGGRGRRPRTPAAERRLGRVRGQLRQAQRHRRTRVSESVGASRSSSSITASREAPLLELVDELVGALRHRERQVVGAIADRVRWGLHQRDVHRHHARAEPIRQALVVTGRLLRFSFSVGELRADLAEVVLLVVNLLPLGIARVSQLRSEPMPDTHTVEVLPNLMKQIRLLVKRLTIRASALPELRYYILVLQIRVYSI